MNNLDFGNHSLFSWYVALMAVSGIAMVILGAINVGGQKGGWRVLNILAGAAFAGYAYYLGFVFDEDVYHIYFQAFILPVLLIAGSVKAVVNRRTAPAAPQPAQPPAPPAHDPNAQPLQPSPVAPAPQPSPVAPAPQPAQPAPTIPTIPPARPVADNPYAQPQQPPQTN
ncbi:hypothetical protein ACFV4F_24395 [Kitasatospora sp. NPDC059722]|uniref:hypothetical protein n=1 Tax=Kitasatospora sp. NPDC059722 TaxID=3346925 RepID=UPI0036A33F16